MVVRVEGLIGCRLGFLVGGSLGADSIPDLKNHLVIDIVIEMVASWDIDLMDGSITDWVVCWVPTRSST